MRFLEFWNHRLVRRINRMEEQVLIPGRQNDKAARAFRSVMDVFKGVLPQNDNSKNEVGYCRGLVAVERHGQELELELKYEMKNMLMGRSYDLVVCSYMDAPCSPESFVIKASFEKRNGSQRARFVADGGGKEAVEVIRILDIPLIRERLEQLSLMDFRIIYEKEAGRFRISAGNMNGSSTWCLIPPVFQWIPLSAADAVRLIELYELVVYQLSLLLQGGITAEEAGIYECNH